MSDWTQEQIARLRDAYAAADVAELARELGRKPKTVSRRARTLGLRSARFFSAEETELVRELYPTHTAEQIAARLPGRDAAAVHRLVRRLGMGKLPRLPPEYLGRVRRLHAQGLPDRLIAERIGVKRGTARFLRERLGLPSNRDVEGKRRAIRKQFERLGITTSGELRARSYRRYARENGWPEDLRPRAVQILNLLAAAGVPLTRRQIADGIGVPWKGSRKSLVSNDPEGSYLAHLTRRGLVQVLKRAVRVTGQGRGRSVSLYLLGPAALAILKERSDGQAIPRTEIGRGAGADARGGPGRGDAAATVAGTVRLGEGTGRAGHGQQTQGDGPGRRPAGDADVL